MEPMRTDLLPARLAESHPLRPALVDFSDPLATIPLGPAAVLPQTGGTIGRGWTFIEPPGPDRDMSGGSPP